jgi:Uma2 family endonuclease
LDATRFELFSEGVGLVIRKTPLTCRAPDIVVFDRASLVEADGYFHSAPILSIEVLSRSETRRQTAEKIADYESIGVREVWVVSLQASTIKVLLLENGRFRRTAILAEGILTLRDLPDVQIDVARIWPD